MSGNPGNPALPPWPRYESAGRSTMMLGMDNRVASDPGGEARRALDSLPVFEYGMPINYVRA